MRLASVAGGSQDALGPLPLALNEPLAHAWRLVAETPPGADASPSRLIQAFLVVMRRPQAPDVEWRRLFPETAPPLADAWEYLRWCCQLFSLRPAHLGAIYERLLGVTTAGCEARKAGGRFYTPDALAQAIARELMARLAQRQRRLETGLSLLDPALGGGVFLRACAEALTQTAGCASARVWKSLYGLDCDPHAVTAARLSLWAQADARSQTASPLAFMADRLQTADSLLTPVARRFDGVIGNPPYRSVKRGLEAEARRAYEGVFQTAVGQYDLYALFIERALEWLAPGGILAFLLPKPFLVNDHQRPVRELLLQRRLLAFWDVGRDAFSPHAAVENVVVFLAQEPPEEAAAIDVGCWDRLSARVAPQAPIYQREILRFEEKSFNLWLTPCTASFLDAMAAHAEPLETFLADGSQGRGAELGKRDCLKTRRSPADQPILSGQDVTPFHLPRAAGFYVHPERFDGRTLKAADLYRAPRLLVRRVADAPVAAVDETTGWWTLNTLYNFHLRDPDLLQAICALLNSPPARAWFRLRYYFSESLFPYLRQAQILAIPLPPRQRLETLTGAPPPSLPSPLFPPATTSSTPTLLQELTFLARSLAQSGLAPPARTALHDSLLSASCRAYGVDPADARRWA